MADTGATGAEQFIRGWNGGIESGGRRGVLADWPADCATRRVDACPACGDRDYTCVAERDRYGWVVDAVQCPCGLVYLRRTFTYEGAETFYAKHYRPLVNAWHGKPDGYDWKRETFEYRSLVSEHWPQDADDWFDVGGEDCNPEHGSGLIETMNVTRQYDLVTCCQTLDHLLNPVAAFHKFAQLVRRGGHLWVDYVSFAKTKEIKADHPLNWTLLPLVRLIDRDFWTIRKVRALDDRHLGVLMERQ
jgi:hypothetical protein